MENISLEPTCTSIWFWYFLDFFSVLNKICWMLSTESRIINSVGLTNDEVYHHRLSEKSRYLRNQGIFALYYCYVLRVQILVL